MKKYYLKYKNIKDIQKVYIDANWNGYNNLCCYINSDGYSYLLEKLDFFKKGIDEKNVYIGNRQKMPGHKYLEYNGIHCFPIELFTTNAVDEELE